MRVFLPNQRLTRHLQPPRPVYGAACFKHVTIKGEDLASLPEIPKNITWIVEENTVTINLEYKEKKEGFQCESHGIRIEIGQEGRVQSITIIQFDREEQAAQLHRRVELAYWGAIDALRGKGDPTLPSTYFFQWSVAAHILKENYHGLKS